MFNLYYAAGLDFSSPMMTDSLLTLSNAHPNDTVTISIINDTLFEPTESFMVQLAFSGGPMPRITLSPSTATVSIFDDDGKQLQLCPTVYTLYSCSQRLSQFSPTIMLRKVDLTWVLRILLPSLLCHQGYNSSVGKIECPIYNSELKSWIQSWLDPGIFFFRIQFPSLYYSLVCNILYCCLDQLKVPWGAVTRGM